MSLPLSDVPAAGFKTVDITAPQGEARLDRFLATALPEISRSRLKVLIQAGQVACGAATERNPSATVKEGAHYVVSLPESVAAEPLPQDIPLDIMYEDAHLLVLDKPAGLVVHPAPGNPDGTLVNALLAHCGETLPGIGGERRPGIVHRLDKDTSGIMVVAKSELAMTRLCAAFAARDLDRAYLAICWGCPSPAAGEIAGDIGRDPRDRKRMAIVTRNGKHALTRYATQQVWLESIGLLECRLATGRTHQIRVHLASKGHPLVGDPLYMKRLPAIAKGLPTALRGALLDFPRQALHAARLGFAHPITGEALSFTRPPPADFLELLAQLNHAQ